MQAQGTGVVLAARGLEKAFRAPTGGRVVALDAVDLDLARGEVLGLVGPNGAGKSTIVALALGLVRPDAGAIRVLGETPGAASRARTGWVGAGDRSWYLRLDGRSNLRLFAGLYGLAPAEAEAAIRRVAAEHELEGFLDRRVSDLSSGMRARLELARATLHRPVLLLLDEPARALDAASRQRLRTRIREAEDRPAVLYVSHDLAEVEAIADRVCVLLEGRVRGEGSVRTLARSLERAEPTYVVDLEGEARREDVTASALPAVIGAGGRLVRVERVGGALASVVAASERLQPPPAMPEWSGPPVRGRPPGAGRAIRALARADLRHELSYPVANLGALASALVLITGFYFLGEFVDGSTGVAGGLVAGRGGGYFDFVLLGLALAGFQTVAASSIGGAIRGRQLTGTLSALLASPLPPWGFLTAGALWPMVRTLTLALLYLGVGTMLGGLRPGASGVSLFVLCATLTVAASAGFGLVSAAFLLRFQRGDPVSFVMGVATALLAGIYFPVEVLPDWLGGLGQLLPLTHGLAAFRAGLADGAPAAGPHLLALVVVTLIALPLGALAVRAALADARVRGTLGRY